MRALLTRSVTLGLAVLFAGCGDDSFSPTVENVSGSYTATTFTVTSPVGTFDLLALGSSVSVTLAPNGTTTGRLVVPGGGEGGQDLDEDLTGTWTLSGDMVTFSQSESTLLQGVTFTAGRNRLTADGSFEGRTIHVVLTKAE